MTVEIKKKPRLSWWWFLLAPLLLFGMLFLQAFGPGPEIEIGPSTTVISEPLRDNGMPNYSGFIVNKALDGVTPENNAAIPLLRALWPMELNPDQEPYVLEALQMPRPDPTTILVSPYETSPAIKAWILREVPNADEDALDEDFLWGIVEDAMHATWDPGELPTMDKWAKQNELPIDWLVEGAARPKYYFPQPDGETVESQCMISWLLPDVQAMRQATRALCVRSMWHLSNDRHAECWNDLLACYRIARHTNKGFSLVHNLVSIAIESMAVSNVHQLIHDEDISEELLAQIHKDLEALAPRRKMDQFFQEGERFAALDVAIRIANGTLSADELGVADMSAFQVASSIRVDWNIVLKEINGWYDRHATIAQLPYAQRLVKLEELDNDIQRLTPQNNPSRMAQGIISMNARSQIVADTMMMLMLPALQASIAAEDRALAYEDLIQASLALARYHKKNGKYPETLADLVPDFAAKTPVDLYTDSPFAYQTKPDGFLLYSLFEDGTDNGGTGIAGEVVEGEYVREETNVDIDLCDLVVRIPKPPFAMPVIPLIQPEQLSGTQMAELEAEDDDEEEEEEEEVQDDDEDAEVE